MAATPGPSPYDPTFAAAGAQYGVDPVLLREMARAESGFDPKSQSPAGAEGIMQFMPDTAAGLGVDPWDVTSSIYGAAKLMAGYLTQYAGSVPIALAAYNAGPGNVKKYGGVPPFAETQSYIARITGNVAAVEKNGGGVSSTGSTATPTGDLHIGPIPIPGTGGVVKDVRKIVLEGLFVLGGVGLIAAAAWKAGTGKSLAQSAKNTRDRAASAATAAAAAA